MPMSTSKFVLREQGYGHLVLMKLHIYKRAQGLAPLQKPNFKIRVSRTLQTVRE
jgi:hypothetical protein